MKEVLSWPWKDALVVKLLGKSVDYPFLKNKLKGLWRLKGGYDVLGVGNGYFLVKFDLQEDRERVISDGPWMLQDHYLAVKRWSPSFNPCDACFGHTLVWIRFTGLNVWYYDERALRTIAAAVGRPVKVDTTTKRVERGKFARVCVEVDLSLPVVKQVWVEDHWHQVDYESLHLICRSCGCYGHVSRSCHAKNLEADEQHPVTVVKQSECLNSEPTPPLDYEKITQADADLDTLESLILEDHLGADSSGWATVKSGKKSNLKPKVHPHINVAREVNKGKNVLYNVRDPQHKQQRKQSMHSKVVRVECYLTWVQRRV